MIAGVGIDVVDVARVHALLARKEARAVKRLFTDAEVAYCASKAVPHRHYAARVAAKEACFKALSGTPDARGIGWREIEVQLDDIGRPTIALHGRAELRARELGVARIWVSLSHSDTTAAATVILETDP